MRTASSSDLGERTAQLDEIVVGFAGADLVAGENAIFELVVERTHLGVRLIRHEGLFTHRRLLASAKDCTVILHRADDESRHLPWNNVTGLRRRPYV